MKVVLSFPIMAALHPNPILLPSFCEEKEGYGSAEQAAEAETRPVAHGQNYNTNVQRQANIHCNTQPIIPPGNMTRLKKISKQTG